SYFFTSPYVIVHPFVFASAMVNLLISSSLSFRRASSSWAPRILSRSSLVSTCPQIGHCLLSGNPIYALRFRLFSVGVLCLLNSPRCYQYFNIISFNMQCNYFSDLRFHFVYELCQSKISVIYSPFSRGLSFYPKYLVHLHPLH